MKKQDKTPLYMLLPNALYQRLKDTAHENRTTMTAMTCAALEVYLVQPIASTEPIPQLKPFSRFTDAWRGKSFSFALAQLGIKDPSIQEIHAMAAGVALSEKATQADAYVYLLARAEERGL